MADTSDTPSEARGFPFVTAAVTLVTLFAFLALMVIAARSPSMLDAPKSDAPDARVVPSIDEVKARNDAALAGVGAKMSQVEARGKLLATLKGPTDTLPFPAPEPGTVTVPAPKKDDKGKDDKGKTP